MGDSACFCLWDVHVRRKPAHLPLKYPLAALGVSDRMRPVAGGTARRATAPLRRVSLATASTTYFRGRAGTFPVSVALALLTAEGQRHVEAGGVPDVLEVYVFWLLDCVERQVQ